jgi:glycosyltransferase involved in cell wall biosynthesis
VGGLPEVVTDGRTGFTVPPESPAALADACGELLQDEIAAVEMGDGGHEFKNEHMSWDRITDSLMREYGGEVEMDSSTV